MNPIMTVAVFITGIWFGGLAAFWRLAWRSDRLDQWETDLAVERAELCRLIDIVAEERRQLDAARGRHRKGTQP